MEGAEASALHCRPAAAQVTVDARPPDLKPLGDLSRTNPLSAKLADLFSGNARLATLVPSLSLGFLDPLPLAFFPQVRLELSERGEHVQEQPAIRGGGVDSALLKNL
jgi:hypothetical protein